MNIRGFSLTELMIVIALIGILSAMGTFAFSQYSKKSQIASQTRLLYGDLMEYRIKTLYEKKNWTFKVAATSYGIYSSANITVSPVKVITLKHSVESDNSDPVVFDTMGMTSISSGSSKSVCIVSENDAAVDAVVISTSRIQMGKKKVGVGCVAANIDAK